MPSLRNKSSHINRGRDIPVGRESNGMYAVALFVFAAKPPSIDRIIPVKRGPDKVEVFRKVLILVTHVNDIHLHRGGEIGGSGVLRQMQMG